MDVIKLWHEGTEVKWKQALAEYYQNPSVKANLELEKKMNNIKPEMVQEMDAEEFYDFLHDEFFIWKFTAKNRLETTRKKLERYKSEGLQGLRKIQIGIFKLFEVDPEDTEILLCKTQQIHGLGTAGASGLLSILFPRYYGTVDQFLVRSLCRIEDLPEQLLLKRMNPDGLTKKDGVVLENILRKKSMELNECFKKNEWTPRKIDMVLWAYDRG